MKLTKARLIKVLLNENQTRKRFKNKKVLTHTNTCRNKKINSTNIKNIKNMTLKNCYN